MSKHSSIFSVSIPTREQQTDADKNGFPTAKSGRKRGGGKERGEGREGGVEEREGEIETEGGVEEGEGGEKMKEQ